MDKLLKDDFIKNFASKSYDELMQIKQKSGGNMVFATYDYLRVCRTLEMTGKFKEGGYKNFEDWINKETFLSISRYHKDLRIAKDYEEKIVQAIGFASLEIIDTYKILEKPKKLLIEKLTQEVEKGKRVPSRKEVKELASKLAVRKEKSEPTSEINILRSRLKEAKKTIKVQVDRIRELQEKILAQEVTLEDQKRYIKELQEGKRAV